MVVTKKCWNVAEPLFLMELHDTSTHNDCVALLRGVPTNKLKNLEVNFFSKYIESWVITYKPHINDVYTCTEDHVMYSVKLKSILVRTYLEYNGYNFLKFQKKKNNTHTHS